MRVQAVRDLKYSKADNSTVDLVVTCDGYGEFPTTLNIVDTEDLHTYFDGQEWVPLEAYCIMQEIAPYTAPAVAVVIPSQITMRQTRLYLLSIDLLDTVENIVSQNKAWQIEWEYASEVQRTNQLIIAMQEELQLTNQQVDEMFIAASKL
jgi:hypothetical protein